MQATFLHCIISETFIIKHICCCCCPFYNVVYIHYIPYSSNNFRRERERRLEVTSLLLPTLFCLFDFSLFSQKKTQTYKCTHYIQTLHTKVRESEWRETSLVGWLMARMILTLESAPPKGNTRYGATYLFFV